MATKPKIKTLTNSSVAVLNAIRNAASVNYRNYVPVATPDADSIRAIGAVIMDAPALQNEFLSALVNRIGLVLVTSKMYENPWAVFKRGFLEYGESIEEIFVNIAKPFQFDPEVAESELYKREIPDVRSTFHVMNYQKFYKATVSREQLRQAFLSLEGVTDLIAKIVDSMYTGASYDEYVTMKYMVARRILDGGMYPVQIAEATGSDSKDAMVTFKATSNRFEFLSTKYNLAGVATFAKKDDQFIIVNSDFDALIDVDVLAAAFNMDKTNFVGHKITVDGFGNLDKERLTALFEDDQTFKLPTDEELVALNTIPAIVVSRDWFMIYDNLAQMNEKFNEQGLYWNYFYHVWKTFSTSPFANNTVFTLDAPSVTEVTISPSTATVAKGQEISFSASVTTTAYASKAVNWSVDDGAIASGAFIDGGGTLYIPVEADITTVTVTATSVFDSSKTATATVSVV